MALIPITLLTGFLGSGKTTVLNHLVRQPALADALVIINEFGEIALDHQLVAHCTENLIMEMSSGCLCCTIRGDLVKTLRDITWRFSRNGQRQFRRVVIETTGLADPAPIIHTLLTHPQLVNTYHLDAVITTIDMDAGMQTLSRHRESLKQAAVADVLLLTKTDLVMEAQRLALLERLQSINPMASRIDVRHGLAEPSMVLNVGIFDVSQKIAEVNQWLQEENHHHHHSHMHSHHDHHDVNRHDDHIRAHCLTLNEPIAEVVFHAWLEKIKSQLSEKMLRVKGIVHVAGESQPRVIHAVQHTFFPVQTLPAWPSDDRRSRLVLITQDLSADAVAAMALDPRLRGDDITKGPA